MAESTPKTPAANLRAINKFNKEKTIRVAVRLNKNTDTDILAHLETISESKQGYIKRLIRADMASGS